MKRVKTYLLSDLLAHLSSLVLRDFPIDNERIIGGFCSQRRQDHCRELELAEWSDIRLFAKLSRATQKLLVCQLPFTTKKTRNLVKKWVQGFASFYFLKVKGNE